MESIAITGAKGVIGSVLQEGLKDKYNITPIDLPEFDVTNYEDLLKLLDGKKTIIHLAWDMKETAWNQGKSPVNLNMARNVYQAALEKGVKRVIIASSVHADRYYRDWEDKTLLSPQRENPQPWPDVPYGYTKLEIEALGREYAKKGLEVICIRFGGVNLANQVLNEEHKHSWLSHRDATNLLKKILEANSIPNNFSVIYGISNNEGRRIHDISNPFGWIPEDNS